MKKSQGEVFGIALMFVVIVVGILVYSQIKSLEPQNSKNSILEGRYAILTEGALDTIIQKSTGCFPEREKDSVLDLMKYCVSNSRSFSAVNLACENGVVVDSCEYSIQIINQTLFTMFNNTNYSMIPFKMTIFLPEYSMSTLSSVNISNFGQISYKNKIINESNKRKLGYSKVLANRQYGTNKRVLLVDLSLYFR